MDQREESISTETKQTEAVTTVVSVNQTENTEENRNIGANQVDLAEIRCYNCFLYGHYQSMCGKEKRPRDSCFICLEVGHNRHQCPQKRGNRANVSTNRSPAQGRLTSVQTLLNIQAATRQPTEVPTVAAAVENQNTVQKSGAQNLNMKSWARSTDDERSL